MKSELYITKYGKLFIGDSVEISKSYLNRYYGGKFNLIITSPPFPLNKKNAMGTYKAMIITAGLLS